MSKTVYYSWPARNQGKSQFAIQATLASLRAGDTPVLVCKTEEQAEKFRKIIEDAGFSPVDVVRLL